MVLKKRRDQRLIHRKLHGVHAVKLVILHLLDGNFIFQHDTGSLDDLFDCLLRVSQNSFVRVLLGRAGCPCHEEPPEPGLIVGVPEHPTRTDFMKIYLQLLRISKRSTVYTIYPPF